MNLRPVPLREWFSGPAILGALCLAHSVLAGFSQIAAERGPTRWWISSTGTLLAALVWRSLAISNVERRNKPGYRNAQED